MENLNPYKVVENFESLVADYAGSKYAVAVDSCTNALFLCCKYLNVQNVCIPQNTYYSVPCSIINAGGKVSFEDIKWEKSYYLKPYPIIDAATCFVRNMYIKESFYCVSFSANKKINIGKGGMILTDSLDAKNWFKMARYMGKCLEEKTPKFIGWNMYMTPEQAARGILLFYHNHSTENYTEKSYLNYPNLKEFNLYEK